MADTIQKIEVGDGRFEALWGVRVNDYKFAGKLCDLQDLLVGVSQQRAVSIEEEVKPLKEIITRRNKRLDQYGKVLQALTSLQASYSDEQRKGNNRSTNPIKLEELYGEYKKTGWAGEEFWKIMKELGYKWEDGDPREGEWEFNCRFSRNEGYVSQCKSSIDSMNNDSQRDMNRMQAIVDRRDESYSTATSLMTNVSDTRSSLIKNL